MNRAFTVSPDASDEYLADTLKVTLGAALAVLHDHLIEAPSDDAARWAPVYLVEQCVAMAGALHGRLERQRLDAAKDAAKDAAPT